MTNALMQAIAAKLDTARDFADLCDNMSGAWPAEVFDALGMSVMSSSLRRDRAEELWRSAQKPGPLYTGSMELPIEHPLDSDWRFTPQFANQLLRSLLLASGRYGKVLLLGLPTIALAAARAGVDDRIIYVTRPNDIVTEAVARIARRATFVGMDETLGLQANCGAVDPPWYDDVAVPMIQRVSAGVIAGGYVLVCGPDRLTKTSAATTLRSLGQHEATLGILGDAVLMRSRYSTPFFERNTLTSLGLTNVSNSWRTGQVHLARRTSRRVPLFGMPQDDHEEVGDADLRIWLCTPQEAIDGPPVLLVAPTVSRTDPNRRRAVLWTSGNTVGIGQFPRLEWSALPRHFVQRRSELQINPIFATLAAEKETISKEKASLSAKLRAIS